MKRIIYTILLISWMVVIFIFSNQNGVKSSKTSNQVTSEIINTVTSVAQKPITQEKKVNLMVKVNVYIRKSAHFTLFFILGILAYFTFSSYSVPKTYLWAILFCLIYAISDEVHQMFISDRAAMAFDVLIDTCGASISIIVLSLFHKFKKVQN